MIDSIRHKALRKFYETGSPKGLSADWIERIRDVLTRLDASLEPEDMNLPGFGLHKLRGNYEGFWAVKVSANRRIVFRFEDGRPEEIDLVDYH